MKKLLINGVLMIDLNYVIGISKGWVGDFHTIRFHLHLCEKGVVEVSYKTESARDAEFGTLKKHFFEDSE